LIRQCAAGNSAPAWNAFVEQFQPVIASTAIKTARHFGPCTTEAIDDLIQDTYLRIHTSRVLQTFRSGEPKAIYGLLQAVTYSVVQDYFRNQGAQKRGGKVQTIPIDADLQGADSSGADAIERNALIAEIKEILHDVAPSPRDRRIFWLYYRHGLSTKAIARLASIGLSQKGVESVIQRLKEEVRRRFVNSVKFPPGEKRNYR